tara:strand:- start:1092 stop:1502 length:411 start_codon:yes stop_codon:yes gene_type:complete
MQHIIEHDITHFLFSISIKYNIDLEILRDRYIPIITIEKKKYIIKRKINPRKEPTTTTHPETRCSARTWNNGFVAFNNDTNQWICGGQCTKPKYANKPYCPQHLKLIDKHGELVHGDFFRPPPHPHFEKFKQKLNT